MDSKNLIPMILSFVLVGVLVSIGMIVFNSLGDAGNVVKTVTAESVTWANPGEANISLAGANVTSGSVAVTNSTGAVVDASNYTVDYLHGALQVKSNVTCIKGATCSVNYVWTDKETLTKTATQSSVGAIAPITTTWIGLIVTVSVLALILALVVMAFVGMGSGRR